MKTIIVPTDFSKQALNAALYAMHYAAYNGYRVILFHNYLNPVGEFDIPFSGIHLGKKEALEGTEIMMHEFIGSLRKKYPGADPEWVVKPGLATEGIIKFASSKKATMIIMGTTGRGAVARLFGSTTSYVISHAPCDVLAIPPKAKFRKIQKVALALDLEHKGFTVVDQAVSFAKQNVAEVTFMHVTPVVTEAITSRLKRIIQRTRKATMYDKLSSIILTDADLMHGLDVIIDRYKPDVLSMVTYGSTFPETLWHSSLTKKMSNHISIPLLILHPNVALARSKKEYLDLSA